MRRFQHVTCSNASNTARRHTIPALGSSHTLGATKSGILKVDLSGTGSKTPVLVKYYGDGKLPFLVLHSKRHSVNQFHSVNLLNCVVRRDGDSETCFAISSLNGDGKVFHLEATDVRQAKEWVTAISEHLTLNIERRRSVCGQLSTSSSLLPSVIEEETFECD